jgi:PAS domain S-box-containing protein
MTPLSGPEGHAAVALDALRCLIGAFPSAAMVVDGEGRVRLANGEAAHLLGRSSSELALHEFDALLSERFRAEHAALRQALLTSSAAQASRADHVVSLSDAAGREINVELALGSLQTHDGPMVLLSLTDLTAKQAVERETMERLSSIFEHAELGIFLLQVTAAGDFVFEDWNPEAERWLGVPRSRARGLRPIDFLCSEEAQRVEAHFRRCVEAAAAIAYESVASAVGNRTLHTTLVPIKDAQGRVDRIMGMARDVSEQKRAERAALDLEGQLRQAQKLEALGTLAGGIAHDFNNLLGVIVALSDLIDFDLDDPRQVRLHLDDMRTAARRAGALVQQILTFSRRQPQARHPIRLEAVVREGLKLLRSTLPTSLQLETIIEADTPIVLADPTQIQQVLTNLAMNAAHAVQGMQGQIVVRLTTLDVSSATEPHASKLKPGRYVRLSVSDNGCGMDADTQKRIFEPFFTTKAPGTGTGLGLAVVHGIMSDHEGQIAVHSSPDQGTTFDMSFPEYPIEASEVHELSVELQHGHGEAILLVDDERHLCDTIARLLSRLGYSPTARTDSLEALELVRKNPGGFDLILTDLTMPELSGVELVRAVVALGVDTPILMMSGYSGSWTPEALQKLGVDQLLAKPISAVDLSHALRNALIRHRALRSAG